VGYTINTHILDNQRAKYGKEALAAVSSQLEQVYGRAFKLKNLRRMMQFAEVFADFEIVVRLSRQLSWSHFIHKSVELAKRSTDYYTTSSS